MSDVNQQGPDDATEVSEAEKIELQRQLALEVEQFEGGIEG